MPRFGDLRSRQIGVLTGSIIVFAIALACIRWIGARSTRSLLGVGLLWLFLTLTFEFTFGRFVLGYSWSRLIADYDLRQGGYLAAGMIVLALAPIAAARVRRVGGDRARESTGPTDRLPTDDRRHKNAGAED